MDRRAIDFEAEGLREEPAEVDQGLRATPRMCGMVGTMGLGLNGKLSQRSTVNPASLIAPSVSRVG